MKRINPDQLINMNALQETHGFRVELAYARNDNLLFGERIYKPDAKLWLYEPLAEIIIKAAEHAIKEGHRFILYDGLRTIEAQEKMLQTQRVKDNPHWLEEPRLLSPPGKGAHPRAMAIDCSLETLSGELLDMGTPFDYLAEDSSPTQNPAHREHTNLSKQVIQNRALLDTYILDSAKTLRFEIIALPQEWWDFRSPSEFYNAFAPIKDEDLPASMRCL